MGIDMLESILEIKYMDLGFTTLPMATFTMKRGMMVVEEGDVAKDKFSKLTSEMVKEVKEIENMHCNDDKHSNAFIALSATPSPSPASRSPCLTIPLENSSTALLESPNMLPNSQAMPSSSIGTFFMLPHLTHELNCQ
ncbi:hypothetical protein VNO77_14166 [Canavalia gladiata]|uniref:Uncharacterized protein n=1 Tax=Canavalia gladiata TaxID=3824 RepID=A0AAN9LXZ6_CANGL